MAEKPPLPSLPLVDDLCRELGVAVNDGGGSSNDNGSPDGLVKEEKEAVEKHKREQNHPRQRQGEEGKRPEYDPHFTDAVIAATGPNANRRLARIMPSLVRHLHDFAREVDLTFEEWMAGVDMVRFLFFPPLPLPSFPPPFLIVFPPHLASFLSSPIELTSPAGLCTTPPPAPLGIPKQ